MESTFRLVFLNIKKNMTCLVGEKLCKDVTNRNLEEQAEFFLKQIAHKINAIDSFGFFAVSSVLSFFVFIFPTL